MMICLTIITIISMLISFFSLKISSENSKFIIHALDKHNEQLSNDIERKRKFIKLMDDIIAREKGGEG